MKKNINKVSVYYDTRCQLLLQLSTYDVFLKPVFMTEKIIHIN